MIKMLHNIAFEQLASKAVVASQCWYQRVEPSAFGPALYGLALEVAEYNSLTDDKILPTLVEEGAAAILLSMVNTFWFWRVLKEAAFFQDDDSVKLTKSSVLKAISAIKHIGSHNKVFGDYCRGEDLSPNAAAYLVASGVLLSDAESVALVRNPVYFKDFSA